jgi:hypothetical protein
MRGMTLAVAICWVCAGTAYGQGFGGGSEWTTAGSDAQRSGWVPADAKIAPDSLLKSGFGFLWKIQWENEPMQLNALTPPSLLNRYMGYRGLASLGFLGGSADRVFGMDTDLGRVEWVRHLSAMTPSHGESLGCPGGMTANVTRTTGLDLAGSGGSGGVGGRGRRAAGRGGVGEPGQGAITIPPPGAEIAGRGAPGGRGGAAFTSPSRMPSVLYALASGGMLHTMYVSNGADAEVPMKFLPPNANAHGLIVIGRTAYTATTNGCGGVPDGVWALNLETGKVTTWMSNGVVAGLAGPAFGPDGVVYAATARGDLVALEPGTLKVQGTYSTGGPGFASSPVVFDYKGKLLIAAATQDGRIHLLDGSSLGGAAVAKTPAYSNATDFAAGALASWSDDSGTRWLLAPSAGPVPSAAGFTADNRNVTNGAVVAWKVVDRNSGPALEPGWVSRDLVSPLAPIVVNGVVFAVSSGEYRTSDARVTAAERAQRSSHAVLYALNPATGKELWNSGDTITSFVHGSGLSSGGSRLYLGTYDGTMYAFGVPMEH